MVGIFFLIQFDYPDTVFIGIVGGAVNYRFVCRTISPADVFRIVVCVELPQDEISEVCVLIYYFPGTDIRRPRLVGVESCVVSSVRSTAYVAIVACYGSSACSGCSSFTRCTADDFQFIGVTDKCYLNHCRVLASMQVGLYIRTLSIAATVGSDEVVAAIVVCYVPCLRLTIHTHGVPAGILVVVCATCGSKRIEG